MRFDRGSISPYFVTDVKSQKVEFKKPYILLFTGWRRSATQSFVAVSYELGGSSSMTSSPT
jgi:hypothetical protein